MLKRFWAWVQTVPVIGWIIGGVLFLLGAIGLGTRRDSGRPAGTSGRTPEEIEAERTRINAELKAGIDADRKETDRLKERSKDAWDKLDS